MARTSKQLTAEELLAVWEIAEIDNEKLFYKDNTWEIVWIWIWDNLTITDWDLNATWWWGSSLWTTLTSSRASNTSFITAWDLTTYINSWMIVRWEESGVIKCWYITSATFWYWFTNVNIAWDIITNIDWNIVGYTFVRPEIVKFAVAWTIWATWTNVANKYTSFNSYRLLACLLSVGTAGTTNNTTVDINKNWTSVFATKPTLATTVASSVTTADNWTSLVATDYLTVDVDAIQTTPAVDLYVDIVLFPTILLNLE